MRRRRDIRKAEKLARLLLSLDDAAREARFRLPRRAHRAAIGTARA